MLNIIVIVCGGRSDGRRESDSWQTIVSLILGRHRGSSSSSGSRGRRSRIVLSISRRTGRQRAQVSVCMIVCGAASLIRMKG